MRQTQHDMRLLDREAQTRSWAAPLPDFSVMPRATEAPKQRLEWDTRTSMNSRIWSSVQEAGPKAVTSEMLARHPTHGANPASVTPARLDVRDYTTGPQYYPVGTSQLPPRSLFQNAWTSGFDVAGDPQNVARELRGAVKEDWGRLSVEAAVLERTFQHQWIPQETTRSIVSAQLDAAERLRPAQDDYRNSFK